jgi:hypothetical protein
MHVHVRVGSFDVPPQSLNLHIPEMQSVGWLREVVRRALGLASTDNFDFHSDVSDCALRAADDWTPIAVLDRLPDDGPVCLRVDKPWIMGMWPTAHRDGLASVVRPSSELHDVLFHFVRNEDEHLAHRAWGLLQSLPTFRTVEAFVEHCDSKWRIASMPFEQLVYMYQHVHVRLLEVRFFCVLRGCLL